MASKVVTYDLCAPGRDYSSLHDAIKSYPGWAKITESCWLIVSDDSCKEIRSNLLAQMDENDRLFIAKLSGEAAWHNALCENEYLKENL